MASEHSIPQCVLARSADAYRTKIHSSTTKM